MSTKAVNRTPIVSTHLAAICLLVVLTITGRWQTAHGGANLNQGENIDQYASSHQSDGRISYRGNSAAATSLNNALNFDGSNDIVDLGNIAVLNGATQYTIEAWVQFETFSIYSTVFAKRVADNDRAAMLQVWSFTGDIAVAVNGGYGYTSEPLNTDTWYHIAVVYDGAQPSDATRLKLYVNGSAKSLTFLDEVPNTTPMTESRFTLGAEYNGITPIDADSSIVVPFDGTIDEVRIWNVARTQSQIQT